MNMNKVLAVLCLPVLAACSSASVTESGPARIIRNDEDVLILQSIQDEESLETVLSDLQEEGLITYISPVDTMIPIRLVNDYYEEENTQRVFTTLVEYEIPDDLRASDNLQQTSFEFEYNGQSITAGRTLYSLSAIPFEKDAWYVLEHSSLESQILEGEE